jgi:hypothetical protein
LSVPVASVDAIRANTDDGETGVTDAGNHRLADLMTAADLSRKALARGVREAAASGGVTLSTDHSLVGKWLDGTVPKGRTPYFIAQAIGARLARTVALAEIGMGAADPSPAADGLIYADDDDAGAATITALWSSDLDDHPLTVRASIEPPAWREASLRWLIGGRGRPPAERSTGRRVGAGEIAAISATVEHFASLDNRFGGGHARRALIQYLSADVAPLLHGRCVETTRRQLFSTVAEATLLAAWSCYDSGGHGLAQRYFIQALRLAQTADDRRLASSILSAMSHQATFLGHYREAADLARAALAGVTRYGTATMRAQFHAMEARALARVRDARACDLALSDAVAHFERRNPAADPLWIGYFHEAELAAEMGHCLRDLGRPEGVALHLVDDVVQGDGSYVRSDFFATMVLADARAAAGHVEEACRVARQALALGEQLKSARCAAYVAEFRGHLNGFRGTAAVRELQEEAAGHPLWAPAT